MPIGLILGIIVALGIITAAGVWSGRQVRNASDFSGGGAKAGSAIVAGTIIGTLVGGSSTVGTAQLAYTYGMSAWWFTLGAGIACLLLALAFAKPLRSMKVGTLTAMIGAEYGKKAQMTASILNSVGTFINIISQLLAGTAIVEIIFPGLSTVVSAGLVALLMLFYVVFGGVWGTGLVGIVKTVLLYLSVILAGLLALHLAGGLAALKAELPHETYFNLFARGIGKDGGAGVSLILGVLSTQTYAQAVLAGRTDAQARMGALISACMIPPIGIGGILVGMYMRVNAAPATLADGGSLATAAKTAFPQFILDHLPPFFSGLVLATLLIAVLGTGAGLSLGISTIIYRDIVSSVTDKFADPKKGLLFSRVCIAAVLILGVVFTLLPSQLILDFSFLSMGLRAAVVFAPLLGALFFKGRIAPRFALAAIIAGPLFVFFGKMINTSFDPLFLGMAAALLIMAVGLALGRKER